MNVRAKRLQRSIMIAAVMLVGVAATAILLIPFIVDTATVRAALEKKLSAIAGGQVTIERIDVQLFPVPRGTVAGAAFEAPGVALVRVDEGTIDLAWRPLLSGRVEIRGIRLAHPTIRLVMPEPRAPQDVDPFEAYRGIAGAMVDGLRKIGGNTVLSVSACDLIVEGPRLARPISVAFDARGSVDDQRVSLDISARSELVRSLHLAGRVKLDDLAAELSLKSTGVDANALLERFAPPAPWVARIADVDLSIEASTDAERRAGAIIAIESAGGSLQRSAKRFDSGPLGATAEVSWNAGVRSFALRRVHVDRIGEASAAIGLRGDGRWMAEVTSASLDLRAVRDAFLVVAGEQTDLGRYVEAIEDGRLLDLKVSFDEDWTAQGRVGGVRVRMPELDLAVDAITGAAAFTAGRLAVRDVSGRSGTSRVGAGALDYDLTRRSLSVSVAVDLDVDQAFKLARRAVPSDSRSAMERIRSASGRLRGSVKSRIAPRHWSIDVALAGSSATVDVEGLPAALTLEAAEASLTEHAIDVTGVTGRLGRSAFRNASTSLAFDGGPRIVKASGHVNASLPEVHQWLAAVPATKAVAEAVGQIAGEVDIEVHDLAGDPRRIEDLKYEVTAVPRGIRVAGGLVPEPVSLDGGSLRLDPKSLQVSGVAVSLLDARGMVSGVLADYRSDARSLDAQAVDLTIGEAALDWTWKRLAVSDALSLRPPVEVERARFRWAAATGLDVQASMRIAGSAVVEADVAWRDETLDLRRVRLADEWTDATAHLQMRGRGVDARFTGVLDGRSVKLFSAPLWSPEGRVSGDLRVAFDPERPGDTRAYGSLVAERMDAARAFGIPLAVDRLNVTADGSRLHVEDGAVRFAGQEAMFRGDIARVGDRLVLDASLDAGDVDVVALQDAVGRLGAKGGGAKGGGAKHAGDRSFPVTGRLRVKARSVAWPHYRVEPLEAMLTVSETRFELAATRAGLCGVAFDFLVGLEGDRLDASAIINAEKADVARSIACLSQREVQLTGTWNVRAELATHGRRGELLRNLSGKFDSRVRDGRLLKLTLVRNVLSMDDVRRLLRNESRPAEPEGFRFRQLSARGVLGGGVLHLEEGLFDSDRASLAAKGTVDLQNLTTRMTVLVAPFDRLTRIVRAIPIIGEVFGLTLLSVPVEVSGDLRNPVVVPLGPAAITNEVTGIFERALQLPARLFRSMERAP